MGASHSAPGVTGRTFEKVGQVELFDERVVRLLLGEPVPARDLELGPLRFPRVKTTELLPRNVGLSRPILILRNDPGPEEALELLGLSHAQVCADCGAVFEAKHERTYIRACRCSACAAVANARAHPATRVTNDFGSQWCIPCPGCVVGLARGRHALRFVITGGRKHVCGDTCRKRVQRFAQRGGRFEYAAEQLAVIVPGAPSPFALIKVSPDAAHWLERRGLNGFREVSQATGIG